MKWSSSVAACVVAAAVSAFALLPAQAADAPASPPGGASAAEAARFPAVLSDSDEASLSSNARSAIRRVERFCADQTDDEKISDNNRKG